MKTVTARQALSSLLLVLLVISATQAAQKGDPNDLLARIFADWKERRTEAGQVSSRIIHEMSRARIEPLRDLLRL